MIKYKLTPLEIQAESRTRILIVISVLIALTSPMWIHAVPLPLIPKMLSPQILLFFTLLICVCVMPSPMTFIQRLSLFKIEKFTFLTLLKHSLIGILIVVVLNLTQRYIAYELGYPMKESIDQAIFSHPNRWVPIAVSISAIVAAPVLEEFLFRRFLFDSMWVFFKRISPFYVILAVVATSLCFAVIHFDYTKIIPITGLGIYLQYLRIRYRSMWAPIGVHCVNNTITVMILILANFYN